MRVLLWMEVTGWDIPAVCDPGSSLRPGGCCLAQLRLNLCPELTVTFVLLTLPCGRELTRGVGNKYNGLGAVDCAAGSGVGGQGGGEGSEGLSLTSLDISKGLRRQFCLCLS